MCNIIYKTSGVPPLVRWLLHNTVWSFYTVIIVVCLVAGGKKSKNETFLQILQQFETDGEIVIERKLIISEPQRNRETGDFKKS